MKTKIIAILLTIGVGFLAAATVPPAEVKEIWDKQCAKCHGKEGEGDTKMGKKMGAQDYSDPKVVAEMNDEEAFKAIKEGLKSDAGKTLMKAYDLTDDEIKGLIEFMKEFAEK